MPASSNPPVLPSTDLTSLREVLAKIAGTDSADKIMSNLQEKIPEEDVEVIDLKLTEEERIVLYSSCYKYFSHDAWLAVGHNMQHSNKSEDFLLPLHNNAAESFWLFHTNEKPARIKRCGHSTKIKGRWLNIEQDSSYSFLHNDTILGKNIIRSAHGPLYFSFNHSDDLNYSLPEKNRHVILKVLEENLSLIN